MPVGYWIPVLHSHLPFVKHPEYDYFLEEHWLFEAITETYLPLLANMKRMVDEGIDFRLTTSITPPLAEMFDDGYLMNQYLKHLDKLIELTEKEVKRLSGNSEFYGVATFYNERLLKIKSFFVNDLNCRILEGYRHFSDLGKLEIITCGATHGFLPLLSVNPKSVEVQLEVAVRSHRKHFGKSPRGIWLPECAYYEGLDALLGKYGIQFFFLDTHGLTLGRPQPKYSVYAPVYTPHGAAAFARDPHSAEQVWSSKFGYPGDPLYRDFYKDIGFDLAFDYVKPYISPDGIRVYTGIKYYRVTGKTEEKLPYDHAAAYERTKIHAKHFYGERIGQLAKLKAVMDRTPVIVSPYDAELYGHWWFEGPDFLYHVFCEVAAEKAIQPLTPVEYLDLYPQNQVVSPYPSTWGAGGSYEVWLNKDNSWIYRHLHHMSDTMEALANKHMADDIAINNRVLNQLLRELLLAQSSDWAFLITMGTAVQYAEKRTKEHISNFNRLLDGFNANKPDVQFLEWLEYKNSIFADADFRVFVTNYTENPKSGNLTGKI
ncbi:MAG: DUF1957 domain-containing protein [Nitrospirae bacterium]|nr:DUF1957 domain-containing protein [Nitrospirota bacterium]